MKSANEDAALQSPLSYKFDTNIIENIAEITYNG